MIFGISFRFSGWRTTRENRVWEQVILGRRVERRMMAGETSVRISDVPKPFILSGEAREPSPIPSLPLTLLTRLA